MLRAATKLTNSRPDLRLRFAVACLHHRHKAKVEAMIAEAGLAGRLPIEVHAARTAELIRLARMAWAVSGSVGLELLMEALPTVVLYKVRRFDLFVARHFIKAKYISLVNLLADAEVFPEYLTGRDVSGELERWAERWLSDPAERARASSVLADLRDKVAVPGATDRAAREIIDALRMTSYRGPRGRHAASEARTSDRGWAERGATRPGRSAGGGACRGVS
jgi:lipid-A-disaccharide synthase